MHDNYTEGQTFEKTDFTTERSVQGEYEDCTFIGCNLSGVNLSNTRFTDCNFSDCNLGNARLGSTTMNNISFKGCKLLGLHFGDCASFLFSVNFYDCLLNYSSFFNVPLKATTFKSCQIREADFTQADLTSAIFDNCDLSKTLFDKSILEKTDFRTAYNYSINPENNRMKKAKFSLHGVSGLLDKYGIEISQ